MPELGRHDPKKMHRLFVKHQDRIFFATDFQVYNKLILGSSSDAERPTRGNLEAAFNAVIAAARATDVVVLYFAGHGVQRAEDDGEDFYFLTQDSAGVLDDAFAGLRLFQEPP